MNRSVRGIALVLALTFAFFGSGAIITTATRAHAGIAVLPAVGAAAAAGLPMSAVVAGVAGGAAAIAGAASLASREIQSGAALAANWAVEAVWGWRGDTSPTLGDPSGPVIGPVQTVSLPQARCAPVVDVKAETAYFDGASRIRFEFRLVSLSTGCQNEAVRLGRFLDAGRTSLAGGTAGHVFDWSPVGSVFTTVWQQHDAPYGWGVDGYTSAGYVNLTGLLVPPKAESDVTTEPGTTPLTVTPERSCSDGSTVYGEPVQTTRNVAALNVVYPACPAGTVPTRAAAPITRTADGLNVGQLHDPWTPPAVPAIYPDCANLTCVMTLTRTAPDGSTATCLLLGECVAYAEVVKAFPEVGTGAFTGPRSGPDGNSYQCAFGPYPVAVAECQVVPNAGLGHAAGTDEGIGSCIARGISWNPTTWVTEPVGCALRSAFDLKPETKARVQTITAKASGKPPLSLLDTVPDWIAPVADVGQTCPDWTVTLNGSSHSVVCGQGFTEKMHDNRLLFGAGMTVALLGSFVWRLWHASLPVIRVDSGK